MHWKSLRRQVRVRGLISREDGPKADDYYASRSLKSRLGAWASRQSQPLSGRGALMAEVAKVTANVRRSGAATGSPRWKSNSGQMANSACMTVFNGAARMPQRLGPSHGSILDRAARISDERCV